MIRESGRKRVGGRRGGGDKRRGGRNIKIRNREVN